jgi:outer membrane protein OmpA-like peptidoglycan-associated protein
MNIVAKFLIGAGGALALGFLGIHASILPGSREAAAEKIGRHAQQALSGDAADWARVASDGQKVVLSGEAESEEAVAALRKKLAPGVIAGPITAVDHAGVSIVRRPPLVDPHFWIAEHRDDALVLSGAAPSEEARDAVYQLAAMRFGGSEISGSLDIARSSIEEDTWLSAASIALQALARLEDGAVEIENERISVSGEAIDAVRANAIGDLLAAAPREFVIANRISIAPRPAPPPPAVPPDDAPPAETPDDSAADETAAAPTDASPAASSVQEETLADDAAATPEEPSCLEAVAAIASERRVSFAFGESDIDAPSRAYLSAIAGALGDCPSLTTTIIGHTDSRGGARRNQTLSLYRADAVAAYLRSVGVSADRLATRGAGESEPVASNATDAGRARNRRIEFVFEDNTSQ